MRFLIEPGSPGSAATRAPGGSAEPPYWPEIPRLIDSMVTGGGWRRFFPKLSLAFFSRGKFFKSPSPPVTRHHYQRPSLLDRERLLTEGAKGGFGALRAAALSYDAQSLFQFDLRRRESLPAGGARAAPLLSKLPNLARFWRSIGSGRGAGDRRARGHLGVRRRPPAGDGGDAGRLAIGWPMVGMRFDRICRIEQLNNRVR